LRYYFVVDVLTCFFFLQIDKLNLEGYANLENWVAELDKKIEGILLQRLAAIIQVWCSDFDRNDDGDARRDSVVPVRDASGKRRGGKGAKEEKVCFFGCPGRLM
jgi:dynein heavy chain 1